jgi:cellulose synthase/poly-beta-1,6-N-acetylglucosamine synthase-like glycosyltransferase
MFAKMTVNPPSVTVLVAAYNEAPVIGDVVREALRAVPSGEVLVVDDGSMDGTDRAASDAGARVLRLPANGGKGSAARLDRGARAGDRPDRRRRAGRPDGDPAAAGGAPLRRGSGGRLALHRPLRAGGDYAGQPLGNRFLTSVINLLFSTALTDTQAGFKACRAETLRRANLRADRFDIEVDLLLGVLRAGGRVVEVPVRRAPRQHGKSRLNSLIDGARILRRILALRFGAG